MKKAAQGLTWFLVMAMPLVGCTSMSGYDAKAAFACKAPDGVLCESMSGIYANALHKNLPGQRVNKKQEKSSLKQTALLTKGAITAPISSGMPIRSAPRILRVWFAPWEDSDKDLHDQSYVYLLVDAGQWRMEHYKQRIQNTYRPVHAPAKASSRSTTSQSNISSTLRTQSGSEMIGVRQDRPNGDQAAQLFNGMRTPAQVMGRP